MRKTFRIILIAILLLALLTGCWNRRETTELAIAVALGIDINEEGEYIVSAQILNPKENASAIGGGAGYDTPVTTFTAKGRMLLEAIRKLTNITPRKVYLAHLRMVVIGEKVGKEGIYDALDLLSREPELRTDFYLVISKEVKAEEILKVLTSLEKIPANKLFYTLEDAAESYSAISKVNLNDLIDEIVNTGIQPTLTGVTIRGDPKSGLTKANVESLSPKALLGISGIAVFRENKLVGWLDEQESKGLNYIKGNVESTVIVTEVDDGKVAVELVKTKTNIKPTIKNGMPRFEINISGEANVGEVNTKLDLLNEGTFSEITEQMNNEIKEVVQKAIRKAQGDYKSDIFGFGDRIHKDDPKGWERLEENWGEMFPEVPVTVNSNIELRRIGTISDPFHNELKKE